jgi:hypothetical protein
MRRGAAACLTGFALLTSAALVSQGQPDFSGRWVLVRAEPANALAAGSLFVTQPLVRVNVAGAPIAPSFPTITIERQFVDRTQTDVYRIGVQGGIVGALHSGHDPRDNVPQTRFSVRWEESRLVMETGSYAGSTREAGPYTERIETWHVDDEGRLFVSITERRSAVDVTTVVAAYRRP